jgi:hypothetical protein
VTRGGIWESVSQIRYLENMFLSFVKGTYASQPEDTNVPQCGQVLSKGLRGSEARGLGALLVVLAVEEANGRGGGRREKGELFPEVSWCAGE